MNSSMLAGERRWASARRGGMTVLGKVAVPKPLNLPSQRLENHGVDPNVEIVPKGTLSWGSRPSSSGSNPWMSSSLSPNAEGGTASPSHLSGRPSSGGSGTRPSTAGSERTQEPVANSWGSRPSSASGTLSSSQTSSTLLRPRSAENRPNSSQLSRFADPVSKTSSAWGTGGTADRLGVKSNKGDGFSLSSGDFPTLGTEKDNLMKNTELEDNVRPSSASGRIPHGKEYTRSQADERHGTVNTWSADGPEGAADDIHHPSMEKWHKDPQQFFNPNNTPQHFESWRGPPPMNSPVPAGVWYGGQHPRAPPFGAPPVRPGGFRMEPFPYYCPQIAPPPLADSQPGPPQGLRGPHSKNGDLYRPQMPDAYTRPGMPFRHGFYPGPPNPAGPMNFEGYYGPPPMGYEPDMSYMGVSGGPPAYNSSYLSPAPDIGTYHGRNGRGHHASKTLSDEEVAEDTEEPKRVTLKTRDQCDQREDGGTWEQHVQPEFPYPEKNRLPMISSRKNEWGAEEDANRGMPNENSPCYSDYRGHFADGVKVKSFEGMRNVKAVNDNRTNVSESVAPFPPEIPRVSLGSERDTLPVVTKNSALMHKIDCLNAKMRVPDGSKDLPSAYNRENERDRFKIIDTKTNKNTGKVTYTVGSFERTPASRDFVSGPHEVIDPVSDKPLQPVIAVSRRSHHGGQGRVDHGEGKFNIQDADGWRKRPLTAESSSVITASHNEFAPSSHAHGSNNVDEASGISVINLVGKIEGDSIETHDSSDIQAQRVKMREIAKQRALQREKEEEERTREQRAKALAKLEELNRRTLAGEAGSGKSEKSRVITDIPGEQEDPRTVDKPVMVDFNNANQSGESVEVPRVLPVESDVSTLPAYEDTHDGNGRKIVSSQFSDSRHKRTVYKHRQNNSFQRSYTEKSGSNVPPGPQKDHTHVATNDINPHEHPSSEITPSESNMPNTSEAPASQRRKSNRSGKNKHKLDETPSEPITSDLNSGKESIENIEADDSLSNWESSFSTGIEPDKKVQAQDILCSSLLNEESHNKATNQWRPHASRRLPRNQHANNKPHGGDTAVWAPVRTRNKAKGFADASPNSADESANSAKSNSNMVQNSLKGKRAEMERYVPKPVAKELAQQVNVPNSSSSISTSRSNDGSSGEVNEGDMSHSKHKKDQVTWKQRAPSDSFFMKSVHIVPSLTSEPPKEIQEPKEIGQSVKNEIDPVNAEVKTSSNTETVSKYHSVKGQGAGATGRGKRNGLKGPVTSIRNNTEPERTFSAEDVNQMDRTKENQTWQPKSSSNSENSHQGDSTKSLTMEPNRFSKKEHCQHKTQPGQSVSVKSIVAQESNVGHRQEFEKKAKGGPYSPNQDQPVGPDELPPVNEDVHLERNILSGSRKNYRQNNRSFRGHGNRIRGDWSTSVHDNRPHNAPPFRDNRQKQNLHYEYQPVGPLKGNRPERVEEPNGADNLEQRHRERGQSHSRRGGNFNRRPSAPAAHLDSGWE